MAEGAVGNAPVRCGSTCIDPTAGIVGTEGLVYYCTGYSRYEVQTEKFRRVDGQGLRITIAILGHMGSFVSRANPYFCPIVLRLFDSVVTNTANFY